ncbi:MAG: HAD family phosphatase [Cyclobacteriaceae bacterium]|nr:HAD family phosphatase [Cyclobacteriaceae bacterium]
MPALNNIKNIIFDLGNVIIDLDFPATFQCFSELSGLSPHEVKDRTQGLMFFVEYEKGLISSQVFREQVRELLGLSVEDHQIDRAWNSMLGGIPAERLQLLKDLQPHFRTFALSNTNEIHVQEFNNIIARSTGSVQSFMDHFEKVYYSCHMKMRKPEAQIYQKVLHEQNLRPQETLFIDDNLSNIESASSLGVRTVHLTNPGDLISLFNGAIG